MKKWIVAATLSAALTTGSMLSSTTTSAQAQGFGGGGGGGGQGGGMNRTAKGRLSGLLRGIEQLEKNKAKALTKAQAKTIVGVIMPWKAKPKMSEAEAKTVYSKINGALTTSQKNELDKIAAKNRRGFGSAGGGQGGPGGGPGGGGPGGGPGGGGAPDASRMAEMRARMAKMQGFFKTYNPFYPISKYSEYKTMQDRMKDRFGKSYQSRMTLIGQLAAKAK